MFWDQVSFCLALAIFLSIGSANTLKQFYLSSIKRNERKQVKKLVKNSKFHQISLFIDSFISTNSVITFVGFFTETYLYGGRLIFNLVSISIGYLVTFLILQPFFYLIKDKIKSPFDYLEKRYENGKWCRCLVGFFSALFCFSYSTLFLWANATILHTLFPIIELWTCVVILGAISGALAIFSGFKQNIWISIIQFIIFLIGILTCFGLSLNTQDHFNLNEQWRVARENGRLNFVESSGGLTTRYTVWNQIFSLPIPWCTFHGVFAISYKRYTTMSSQYKSSLFILSNIPIVWCVNLIFVFAGVFSYSYFYGCDPIGSQLVSNKNQIASYWVVQVLSDKLPGLSGTFLASMIGFSFVSYSNGLHTTTCLLLNEVMSPIKANINSTQLKLTISLTGFLVILSTLFAISFQLVKNSILSLFFLFNNSINSPILAVFLQALFNPYSNTFGVCLSFFITICINIWLGLGTVWFSNVKSQEYPSITTNCTHNFTSIQHNEDFYPKNDAMYYLYSISSIWYCQFSLLFISIFGSLLSICFTLISKRRIKPEISIPKDFLFNFKKNFLCFKHREFVIDNFLNVIHKKTHL